MNSTYQVNQVAESQPDADDSTVPISILRRLSSQPSAWRNASWKVGMVTVTKQGDTSRLYTNLRREALWRASQAVLSRQGAAETTKTRSDKVWEPANDTPLRDLVPSFRSRTNPDHSTVGAVRRQT